MHKTYGEVNLDSDKIDEFMIEVFQRQLDCEFMSQFALAFNTIIRLGKDLTAFTDVAPKIFGRELDDDDNLLLFDLYSKCAARSPHYTSRAQASGKARGLKRQFIRLIQICWS